MDTVKFEKEFEHVVQKCQDVLITKGREYQSTNEEGTNVFANFERLS